MLTRKDVFQTAVILIVLSGIFFADDGLAAITERNPEELKRTITTLHKARNNVVRNHTVSADNKQQQTKDEQDFLLFLSYLDGRIYFYCQELFNQQGQTALQDTPCPAENGVLETTQYSPIPELRSQTKSEQIDAFEERFTASLGEFDEMLLKEQEKVASHIPRQGEGSGSMNDSNSPEGRFDGVNQPTGKKGGITGPSSTNKSERTGNNGKNNQGTQSVGRTSSSNDGSGTGSTSQSAYPPTAGNKDFSKTDDDIVARQLREAAEQEADPDVKAKLWEEYRKYKEGIR